MNVRIPQLFKVWQAGKGSSYFTMQSTNFYFWVYAIFHSSKYVTANGVPGLNPKSYFKSIQRVGHYHPVGFLGVFFFLTSSIFFTQ